jgi:hypothetical protein
MAAGAAGTQAALARALGGIAGVLDVLLGRSIPFRRRLAKSRPHLWLTSTSRSTEDRRMNRQPS